jgi:hypothetical protein
MSQQQRYISLKSEAPEPLALFNEDRIDEYNIDLIRAGRDYWSFLPKRERRQLERQHERLRRKLLRSNYALLLKLHTDARADYELLLEQEAALRSQRGAEDAPDDLREQWQAVVDQIKAVAQRNRPLAAALRQLQPLADECQMIYARLERDDRLRDEDIKLTASERKLRQEAANFEQIIKGTFARLPGCHHTWTDERGFVHTDVPQFHHVDVDSDAHWFLLEASYQGLFGFKPALPYAVKISNLIDPTVIETLAAACHRQIQVFRSALGTDVYLKVNRLDQPDGLPTFVPYKSMIELYPEDDHRKGSIPFPIGVFTGNRVRWGSLKEFPHILIAGMTGYGKSTLVNVILATWMRFQSPEELQVYFIDLKGGVEFDHFDGVPHQMGIVTNVDDVLPALEYAVALIEQRLAVIRAQKKKDIYAYNDLMRERNEPVMPHLVIALDEMQPLANHGQMTKDIYGQIDLLITRGRAPGVHLIMCTQHPRKEIIPGSVKGNIDLRLVLKMPDMHASMTVMRTALAADIPRGARGRIAFESGDSNEFAQTPFISDDDVAETVAFAKAHWQPVAAPALETGALPEEESTEEDTSPFAALLPAPAVSKKDLITEAVIIECALTKLGGNLKALRVWEELRDQGAIKNDISAKVSNMIKRDCLEYDGRRYDLVRQRGNFYKLVLSLPTEDETVADDMAEVS